MEVFGGYCPKPSKQIKKKLEYLYIRIRSIYVTIRSTVEVAGAKSENQLFCG